MLRLIVDEDADSRDGRIQFPAKFCCQLIRNAPLRAGEDEADIVGMEFIGPSDVARPLEAAELYLNHEFRRPIPPEPPSYQDGASASRR